MLDIRSVLAGLLVVLGLLGISGPAWSKVIFADDPQFGPGSITVDLSTGYQWLDVTLSQNRSIAEVSTQFGVGGDFEGFRYATRDEVITFFQNAGLTGAFGSDRTAVFQALVGVTENNGFPRTVARVSTQQSPGAYYAPDVTPGSVNPDNCCATETEPNPNGGSWLVRTVVAADDPRFGAGSITVDLSTRYQWLDVTLSQNRSIAEVSTQFGVGGDFEGFRYATRDEVITFFQNAGLTGPFGSDRTAVFQALVGVTENNGFPRTVARVSTQQSPGAYYAPDVTPGSVNPNNCCAAETEPNPNGGSWLVQVPGRPPAPSITAMPANPTNQTGASFSFVDSEIGVTSVCQLDGGPSSACTSPKDYTGLSKTNHTFAVQATDFFGNVSVAAVYAWTIVVDTTAPPAPSITDKPNNPTNQTTASFSFGDAEAGVSFLCKLDGGVFIECTSPASYTGLSQATHTFSVKAQDGAGNQSAATTFTWTVDATPPPVPTIATKPAILTNQTGATFTFTDTQAGVTFLCQLDSSAFSACPSPAVYSGLGQGSHTFAVQARDGAGNVSAAASYAWTVDSTPPPTPSIDSTPANPTNLTTATFAFSVPEAGVTFVCKLDGGAFSTCTSPKTYTVSAGSHTFSVKAQDAAANQSSLATTTWVVDRTAPRQPTITSKPANPTNQTAASFIFTDTEVGVTFLCQLDGSALTPCISPNGHSGLAEGAHVFSVRAQDAAGNLSSAASTTWTIDTTPPPTPGVTKATVSVTGAVRSASFSFSSSQTGTNFLCDLDNGGFTACVTGRTYSNLSPGSHTFSVRSQDAAGNQSPAAAFTWTMVP